MAEEYNDVRLQSEAPFAVMKHPRASAKFSVAMTDHED